MTEQIIKLYAVGLFIGILIAEHFVFFIQTGLTIKTKIWRRLWACSYLLHQLMVIYALRLILSLAGVTNRPVRQYLFAFCLLPYVPTAILCLWKYRNYRWQISEDEKKKTK